MDPNVAEQAPLAEPPAEVDLIRSRPRPRRTGEISLTAADRRRLRESGVSPNDYTVGIYAGRRPDGSRYETRIVECKDVAELVRRRTEADRRAAARSPLVAAAPRHDRSERGAATRAPRAPRSRRRGSASSPSGSSRSSGDDGEPPLAAAGSRLAGRRGRGA